MNQRDQAKVLIIDDDTTLLLLLRQSLEKAGYTVLTAAHGLAGLQQMYEHRPDLIILDVMMPRMDGWETVSRIREMSQVPVIMLSAKDAEADKIRGFAAGVDDYVTKPFSFAELTARVGAVLHRTRQTVPARPSHLYQVGDVTIDLEERRVTKRGETVSLTPTEYKLMAVLVENAGRVLSREQLLSQVWGDAYLGDTDYIKRYVWYLRQKLEDDPSTPEYVLTDRGFGYSFRKD
ncbi:MAG: response regulator transcription factor [Anaerolineae bacterium]|nr:response regulator transcription factor [Anaerolineae bacterium]